MQKQQPKVSVIVPIYGVERYIARCAENLMRQTLTDVEFIFVNDATRDGSMDILQSVLDRFPQRKEQVIIISHNENKGLPAARNTGLSIAKGEYILHHDSDDYMNIDALEQMYSTAKRNNLDIVWCDFYLSIDRKNRYIKQPDYNHPKDAVIGMLRGKLLYNVWDKMIKHDLYSANSIVFPEGYTMGEDMTIIKLFSVAKCIVHLNKAFYHYVQNESSLMGDAKYLHFNELHHNIEDIAVFFNNSNDISLKKEVAFFKLLMKWPLLIDGKKSSFKLWNSWFPESNKYIWQCSHICMRIRFLEWCAMHNCFWIIKIHYFLVLKGYNRIVNKIKDIKNK